MIIDTRRLKTAGAEVFPAGSQVWEPEWGIEPALHHPSTDKQQTFGLFHSRRAATTLRERRP